MEKKNLLKAIKAEHQVVTEEFAVLKRGLGAKQTLLATLETQISEHFDKEEKLLFDKLNKHSRLSGEATKALEQDHKALLQQLKELSAMEISAEDWSEKVDAMAVALQEHFLYEEQTYFKYVRAAFSKADLEEMVGEKPDVKEEKPKKAPAKAEKKAPAKKAPAKKPAAKKPAAKKETAKKAPAKKTEKKPAEKKAAEKKTTAKSTTKKTTTKAKTTPSK